MSAFEYVMFWCGFLWDYPNFISSGFLTLWGMGFFSLQIWKFFNHYVFSVLTALSSFFSPFGTLMTGMLDFLFRSQVIEALLAFPINFPFAVQIV